MLGPVFLGRLRFVVPLSRRDEIVVVCGFTRPSQSEIFLGEVGGGLVFHWWLSWRLQTKVGLGPYVPFASEFLNIGAASFIRQG